MFAMTSFATVTYMAAGRVPVYAPGAAAGTLHFRPACEPLAKQVLQVKGDMTGVTFEQYSRAKIWLDMCSACVDDHGPQCWTLFQRLHPEALKRD